ncbi:unnamed protein product, partial [Prorocentrum cordatum]
PMHRLRGATWKTIFSNPLSPVHGQPPLAQLAAVDARAPLSRVGGRDGPGGVILFLLFPSSSSSFSSSLGPTETSDTRPPCRWKYDLESSGDEEFVLLVKPDGASVFCASGDAAMHAVDTSSGSRQWSFDLDSRLRRAVLSPDGATVFAATAAGTLSAVEASTGAARWSRGWPGGGGAAALAACPHGGRVLLGEAGGGLRALAARTGEELWHACRGGALCERFVLQPGRLPRIWRSWRRKSIRAGCSYWGRGMEPFAFCGRTA